MTRFSFSWGLIVSLLVVSSSAENSIGEVTQLVEVSAEAAQLHAEREIIRDWQNKRFGMFIHWGPVSLKGTEIGWSRRGPRRGGAVGGTGTIPMAEYDSLYKKFNPIRFDADQWAQIAKDAGMKYMVFTSKHHDGFSCFDSKLTDYKITSPASPYGKDICKQLADACHKSGLREMGDWLEQYGDGVYGTRGGPFKPGKWGAATCKDDKVYLFVMNWPKDGPLVLPTIGAKVKGARQLDGGTVYVQRNDDGILVDVPADHRDDIVTVVELTVDGPAFDIKPVAVVHQQCAVESSVLKTLRDAGYDGVLSMECEGAGGPMIERSLTWLRRTMAELDIPESRGVTCHNAI